MTEKRFTYWEEENGEFPFPYIKDSDGKSIVSLYECVECLNALHEENQRLEKQKQHLIDYMDTWCPKRFYNGILRAMEEIE